MSRFISLLPARGILQIQQFSLIYSLSLSVQAVSISADNAILKNFIGLPYVTWIQFI